MPRVALSAQEISDILTWPAYWVVETEVNDDSFVITITTVPEMEVWRRRFSADDFFNIEDADMLRGELEQLTQVHIQEFFDSAAHLGYGSMKNYLERVDTGTGQSV